MVLELCVNFQNYGSYPQKFCKHKLIVPLHDSGVLLCFKMEGLHQVVFFIAVSLHVQGTVRQKHAHINQGQIQGEGGGIQEVRTPSFFCHSSVDT